MTLSENIQRSAGRCTVANFSGRRARSWILILTRDPLDLLEDYLEEYERAVIG
jgi:hypothetical protein